MSSLHIDPSCGQETAMNAIQIATILANARRGEPTGHHQLDPCYARTQEAVALAVLELQDACEGLGIPNLGHLAVGRPAADLTTDQVESIRWVQCLTSDECTDVLRRLIAAPVSQLVAIPA